MTNSLMDRIEKRIAALGTTERQASIAASDTDSPDLIRGIRRRGAGANSESIRALARVLKTTEHWLLTGEGPEEATDADALADARTRLMDAAIARVEVEPAGVSPPDTNALPLDVPVRGTAAGTLGQGAVQLTSEPVDYVRRPPALAGARDLYAIFVTGDSMSPMHPHGELRFVHPHRPAAIGDTVLVVVSMGEHDTPEAYIKLYAKRTPEMIVLEQINPKATIEIKRQYVAEMHKVLTTRDLFGI